MKDIRDYLKEQPLLFDGGMGTYYASRNRTSHRDCEWANLSAPEEIAAIHRAYLDAGCRAIKTNTYGVNRLHFSESNCRAMIREGWQIANRFANSAYVFADIGPIDAEDDMDILAEYLFVTDQFLQLGTKHFLFETLGTNQYLSEIASVIRSKAPDAFILVSFAASPDGISRDGRLIRELLSAAAAEANIDAVGLNCVSGGRQMVELMQKIGHIEGLLSAMPNAGYPTVRGNRTFYEGDPSYFSDQMEQLRAQGVRILGGCCGTTPEHMREASKKLRMPTAVRIEYHPEAAAKKTVRPEVEDPFWTALCDPGRKPFAVELDPPENADVTKFMDGARKLQEYGANLITVADCPVARARIDSSLMACKIRRELSMDAMPHMTCRDRNLNATQALLLGLSAEGINKVLVVTGDPIPAANRDEVKSVYNFNSRKLIKYVDGLNQTVLPNPFRIFAALNVNVRNIGVQLDIALKKEQNGALAFLTQPVLSPEALKNIQIARETLRGKIIGGIMPVVSERNARFMNSEIAGITVDEKIIELYRGADREKGEELAVEISTEIAGQIAPYVDGFYIITPFGRTGLVGRIIDSIRKAGLA